MANRMAPIAAVILCLCFVRAQCDASPEQEQEIQMLKSKLASSEDEISRRKEETSQLESVVRERTAQMAALVGELELLQGVTQIQNGVQGFLEENRLPTPLPADKLAWFTASTFLAVPVLSIFKILSATMRMRIQARKDGGSSRNNKRSVDK